MRHDPLLLHTLEVHECYHRWRMTHLPKTITNSSECSHLFHCFPAAKPFAISRIVVRPCKASRSAFESRRIERTLSLSSRNERYVVSLFPLHRQQLEHRRLLVNVDNTLRLPGLGGSISPSGNRRHHYGLTVCRVMINHGVHVASRDGKEIGRPLSQSWQF